MFGCRTTQKCFRKNSCEAFSGVNAKIRDSGLFRILPGAESGASLGPTQLHPVGTASEVILSSSFDAAQRYSWNKSQEEHALRGIAGFGEEAAVTDCSVTALQKPKKKKDSTGKKGAEAPKTRTAFA
ncbi:hypothetical protein DPEC_G00257460 [Dallia pectoralis]|uniref:Uncharacterized protein n=1 Tax=Dallia pectoralis TaxID=75939 RepID=A0ACC2FQZ8_DALPE|nr:hypothetical protein DPEC_G00257460 [Dallia pectoralis]